MLIRLFRQCAHRGRSLARARQQRSIASAELCTPPARTTAPGPGTAPASATASAPGALDRPGPGRLAEAVGGVTTPVPIQAATSPALLGRVNALARVGGRDVRGGGVARARAVPRPW